MMSRAATLQAAAVCVLVGVTLILFAAGGATRQEPPRPATTYRPAAPDEQRQWEADQLSAELDRIAKQRDLEEASRVPTGYSGY